MPERGVDTAFWSDPFIQKLPFEAKGLYLYLWTNEHCSAAGLYQITTDTISFETKLPADKLPGLLHLLEPKVAWYEDSNLIWVKNFLKHQTRSPKFLIAAAKAINNIHNNGLIKDFLNYNGSLGITIPYQYPIDTVSIPTLPPQTPPSTSTSTSISKEEASSTKKPADPLNESVKLLFEGLKEKRGLPSPQAGAEAVAIRWMLKYGFTVEQILQSYDKLKEKDFWSEKFLSMQSLKTQINELIKSQHGPKQKLPPGKILTNEEVISGWDNFLKKS